MPYDMATTYSPLVTAKQIAGRPLGADPAMWKQLFPTINPTIDGRVPTAQSIQYLVSSRMNASRELIAVAMVPESPTHRTQFEQLFDFLLMKECVNLPYLFESSKLIPMLADMDSSFLGESVPSTNRLLGSFM